VVRHRLPLLSALLAVALLAACGDGSGASGPNTHQVSFVVTNDLVAPVTVAVDGTAQVILSSGGSAPITVPSTAQTLTWTSAKPLDSQRRQIPDDIGEVVVPISRIRSELEIQNVIDDQPYITASIFNATPAAVLVGVFDGSSVACVSELPPISGGTKGFTQTGYYRLLPATELRAYRDASGCTGPYVAWPHAQLTGFAAKSGRVVLTLESAP
jgi:hypothetical protein